MSSVYRMSIIDKLLKVVPPLQAISELPSDVEEIPCQFAPGKLCLRCKVCGGSGGTDRNLNHYIDCRYKQPLQQGPYTMGRLINSQVGLNVRLSEAILQKEYGIISERSVKTILGTYGAGPCIILCMRNRRTTETILAHIDAGTLTPLAPFLTFSPEDSDVYIVGGDDSTRQHLTDLLRELRDGRYTVVFAHVIDSHANRFAINCITGESWIDGQIYVEDLPVTIDKEMRERLLFSRALGTSPLFELVIPNKGAGGGRNRRKTKKRTRRVRRSV